MAREPREQPVARGAKYDAQVIAGLVDDPRRLAELRPAAKASAAPPPKMPDVTAENLQSP